MGEQRLVHDFVVSVGLRLVGSARVQAEPEAAGGNDTVFAEEGPALVGVEVACDAPDAQHSPGRVVGMVVGVGDGVANRGGEHLAGVDAGGGLR